MVVVAVAVAVAVAVVVAVVVAVGVGVVVVVAVGVVVVVAVGVVVIMSLTHRPSREDYFPKTKRGHGTINSGRRDEDGRESKKPTSCVDETCVLNRPKSSNLHTDQRANLQEWCDTHGLTVKSKDRPRAKFKTAGEAMNAATGGR